MRRRRGRTSATAGCARRRSAGRSRRWRRCGWRDFAWTRGAPASFRSSSEAARDFCAACGTPLTFRYLDSAWIDVTIGSLDQPERAPPERQYGSESRLAWFATMGDLPAASTAESMQAERQRRLICYQHPDHDTPGDWQPPRSAPPAPGGGPDGDW